MSANFSTRLSADKAEKIRWARKILSDEIRQLCLAFKLVSPKERISFRACIEHVAEEWWKRRTQIKKERLEKREELEPERGTFKGKERDKKRKKSRILKGCSSQMLSYNYLTESQKYLNYSLSNISNTQFFTKYETMGRKSNILL